eukprot:3433836-Alexandrium_andersonii.AAC.1
MLPLPRDGGRAGSRGLSGALAGRPIQPAIAPKYGHQETTEVAEEGLSWRAVFQHPGCVVGTAALSTTKEHPCPAWRAEICSAIAPAARPKASTTLRPLVASLRRRAVLRRRGGARGGGAVSYTHLTLPTICSV